MSQSATMENGILLDQLVIPYLIFVVEGVIFKLLLKTIILQQIC